jgi:putative tricarboxylic transport membrane protein
VFLIRPISLGMLAAAASLLVLIVLPNLRKKREEVFEESET